ncbi:MAG: type VI secretion system-associated FHA domain protein TagH [Rubrivivax sp.]
MILLTVLSYNGTPAKGPSASFDELGGTIGRADNNQLVLPDPERTISRVHAKVVFRSGGFAIVDNGSNPISVNGVALGSGREQPLKPGDEVQIGGYLLQASPLKASVVNDPFADLFGDAAAGLAVPPPAPAPMVSVTRTWAPAPGAGGWPSAAPAPAPALKPGHIPDDWDPFGGEAPMAAPRPGGSGFGQPNPLGLGGGAGPGGPMGAPAGPGYGVGAEGFGAAPASDSLDDLFGLAGAPLQGDPLGAAPAQAFGQQPNTAADADPLAALGRTAPAGARGSAASEGFSGSELNTPMPLKRALPPSAVAGSVGAAPAAPAATASPALPAGAIFSWDAPSRDGKVVTLPGAPRAAGSPAPVPPPPPAAAAVMSGVLYPPPAGATAPVPSTAPAGSAARLGTAPGPALDFDLSGHTGSPGMASPVPAAATAAVPQPVAAGSEAALLEALMRGLGVPGLRWDTLTPARMELLGQLLRESTRGAVELLVARAALKREMRAEMTMIVARENNPLKFSPSVEVALQHLLGEPAPGFMAPAPAMRDAFDDVRAHQLGVMAGMKAAMEGVVQRFDPAQLESKLTRKSAINSLIPATRKARLWELFQELFGQISAEAQDDFQELFGRAFLRAYEAQLDRLAQEPGPR